jgi:hypothetical protein
MVLEAWTPGFLFTLYPCLPLGQGCYRCALVVNHRHVCRSSYNNPRRMSSNITVRFGYSQQNYLLLTNSRMWALNRDASSKMTNSLPSIRTIADIEMAEVACNRAVGNLILMAVCNIVLNVALIILPFPMLRHLRLDLKEKLQLGFLFSVGAVLVAITILRLPLILNESVSQRSRSMVRRLYT